MVNLGLKQLILGLTSLIMGLNGLIWGLRGLIWGLRRVWVALGWDIWMLRRMDVWMDGRTSKIEPLCLTRHWPFEEEE